MKKSKQHREPENKTQDLSESVINLRAQLEKAGSFLANNDDLERKDGINLLTGILPLDLILTPKIGFQSGCVEIYGPEGIGKTSLALSILKSAKKSGIVACYVDVEYGLTDELCKIFDVVPNKDFILSQPDNAEAALNSAEIFLKNSKGSVVIIDSIANLMSQAEMDAGVEEKLYNPVSIMLSNFAKKSVQACRRNNHLLIYLNQVRDNMNKQGYGPMTRVPGPRAVKFSCAWRIEMRRISLLKEGGKTDDGEAGEVIGQKVGFKTIKNRSARPFQEATSNLIYGKGFHQGYDLCELCAAFGMKDMISREGSWYTLYTGDKIQGINNVAEHIVNNPEIESEIKNKIIETCRI